MSDHRILHKAQLVSTKFGLHLFTVVHIPAFCGFNKADINKKYNLIFFKYVIDLLNNSSMCANHFYNFV